MATGASRICKQGGGGGGGAGSGPPKERSSFAVKRCGRGEVNTDTYYCLINSMPLNVYD